MKKVAIVGTNGIPARYGGFETLAENIVSELNNDIDFIIYCSNIYEKEDRQSYFKNARLIYLPFKANGLQSLFYDFFSFVHALCSAETILFLGPTSSGIITVINCLFGRKLIVNHGGLNEWEREKYSENEKKWAKLNHYIAAKNATINITDNSILQKSLLKSFGVDSVIIRYGGDHHLESNIEEFTKSKYKFEKNKYYLSVARAQVDNNIHLLIDAFKSLDAHHPLVIVSNWGVSEYGKKLLEANKNHKNLILLDAIYDLNLLNYIRSNCYAYIHSHSFCGTAPSLVEVMNLNVPVICFDVPTNRESTKNKSIYFKSSKNLVSRINSLSDSEYDSCKKAMFKIASNEYTWDKVSLQYLNIF
jgi:glycosyltransferase involved in cell wall biosynthesis